jgi:hypothetical protein
MSRKNFKLYTALKVIKKTKTIKTCRGCGKDIPVGSSCISLYQFLGVKFANDYFHNVDCVKNAINSFFHNLDEMDIWMKEKIEKSLKKVT